MKCTRRNPAEFKPESIRNQWENHRKSYSQTQATPEPAKPSPAKPAKPTSRAASEHAELTQWAPTSDSQEAQGRGQHRDFRLPGPCRGPPGNKCHTMTSENVLGLPRTPQDLR